VHIPLETLRDLPPLSVLLVGRGALGDDGEVGLGGELVSLDQRMFFALDLDDLPAGTYGLAAPNFTLASHDADPPFPVECWDGPVASLAFFLFAFAFVLPSVSMLAFSFLR